MATLLDFFKRIPCKKAKNTSPVAGDTPGKCKNNSPKETARGFTAEKGKENGKGKKSKTSTTMILESDEEDKPDSCRKRMHAVNEAEESDNEEVTGRKVINFVYCLL